VAAKEKTSRLTAWLAPILFLLAAVAAAVPAPALTARATETRAWEKTPAPLESRLDESLQLLNLHQQNGGAGYDDALGSPLAAESAGAQVAANRIAGAQAVDDFIANAEANGAQVAGREVSVQTPFGLRRYDVVLRDPATGALQGVEVKSSVGAFNRFDAAARQQFAADRWVNQYGADAVGQNASLGRIQGSSKILWTGKAP
jgi:hypothetical protein